NPDGQGLCRRFVPLFRDLFDRRLYLSGGDDRPVAHPAPGGKAHARDPCRQVGFQTSKNDKTRSGGTGLAREGICVWVAHVPRNGGTIFGRHARDRRSSVAGGRIGWPDQVSRSIADADALDVEIAPVVEILDLLGEAIVAVDIARGHDDDTPVTVE